MRIYALGVLAAALSGCTPSVSDMALAGLDLADGKTLAALQSALPPDDRAALGTYALLHWPKSQFYCGQPIGGRTTSATTVAEAIALTRAYEVQLARSQRDQQESAAVSRQKTEKAIITRMDQLALNRDTLYVRGGPTAINSRQAEEIKRELAALREQLESIRETRSVNNGVS